MPASWSRGNRDASRFATAATALVALAAQPALAAGDPWRHLSVAPALPAAAAAPSDAPGFLVPATVRVPLPIDDAPPGMDRMSFQTAQSVACLATGGVATLAALGFGWQNVTNLISGGVVPAAGPGAVALGLFGVVFASFCAIGQALTPLYLDLVHDVQLPPTLPPAGTAPSAPEAAGPRTAAPVVVRVAAPAQAPPPGSTTAACGDIVPVNRPRAGPC
jgi:hypothetical protein